MTQYLLLKPAINTVNLGAVQKSAKGVQKLRMLDAMLARNICETSAKPCETLRILMRNLCEISRNLRETSRNLCERLRILLRIRVVLLSYLGVTSIVIWKEVVAPVPFEIANN